MCVPIRLSAFLRFLFGCSQFRLISLAFRFIVYVLHRKTIFYETVASKILFILLYCKDKIHCDYLHTCTKKMENRERVERKKQTNYCISNSKIL